MLRIRSIRWSANQLSQSLITSQAANKSNNKLKCRELHSTKDLHAVELKMPSLSPTMEEGTIVKWLKNEGEKLEPGDVVCDIQTDKAVVSMEVDDDGVLAKIIKSSDSGTIKIGELIALVAEDGEDWQQVAKTPISASAAPVAAAPPKAAAPPPPKAAAAPVAAAPPPPAAPTGEHSSVLGPATSLLLTQYGINPASVPATGPKGNLLKGDVLGFIKARKLQIPSAVPDVSMAAASAPAPVAAPKPRKVVPKCGYTDHELSNMRKVIAKRLSESKQTAPHGYSSATANIDAISRLRQEYIRSGLKVSINDFVIKAVATALLYVPALNVNIIGDEPVVQEQVDISIAVATDAGLITPIVKNVTEKSIQKISADVKELAGRAKQNKLKLDEFQGGTFTISNLGMFGVSEFTAIINSPQAAILAVGGGTPTLDGEGKAYTAMTSTLSFDRRYVDEATAADFMSVYATILERPELLGTGYLPSVKVDRMAAQIQ